MGTPLLIAAVDVGYRGTTAVGAGVAFEGWGATEPRWCASVASTVSAGYVAGEFRRRELAPVLGVLEALTTSAPSSVRAGFDAVIIDGYVWLGADRAGLGAYVYEAIGEAAPVVGVAKNPFEGNDASVPVLRGSSRRPLFVTAAGMDVEVAAARVRSMAGPNRIPTLLKRVDQLSRVGT